MKREGGVFPGRAQAPTIDALSKSPKTATGSDTPLLTAIVEAPGRYLASWTRDELIG